MKSKPWIWWGSIRCGHFILGKTATILSVRALQKKIKFKSAWLFCNRWWLTISRNSEKWKESIFGMKKLKFFDNLIKKSISTKYRLNSMKCLHYFRWNHFKNILHCVNKINFWDHNSSITDMEFLDVMKIIKNLNFIRKKFPQSSHFLSNGGVFLEE